MPINVNKTFEEKYVRTKNKDENITLECLQQRQNERTMNHTLRNTRTKTIILDIGIYLCQLICLFYLFHLSTCKFSF